MKKKLLWVFLALLIGVIILIIWQPLFFKVITGQGTILNKMDFYYAVNENGKEINADFYLKKTRWQGHDIKEIIVRFKEILPDEHWFKNDYYLVVIPDSNWIGRPDQAVDYYKIISEDKLYQSEPGSHFKIINTPEGRDVYQLIENSSFKNDTIRFSTFQTLDQLGKEIIIIPKS